MQHLDSKYKEEDVADTFRRIYFFAYSASTCLTKTPSKPDFTEAPALLITGAEAIDETVRISNRTLLSSATPRRSSTAVILVREQKGLFCISALRPEARWRQRAA